MLKKFMYINLDIKIENVFLPFHYYSSLIYASAENLWPQTWTYRDRDTAVFR